MHGDVHRTLREELQLSQQIYTYYINHLLEENQATWCKSFYVNIYSTEVYKPGDRDINAS